VADKYNGYTTAGRGKDILGERWEVGVRGPGMVLTVSPTATSLAFDGDALTEFAQAVARGQQLASDWASAAAGTVSR